MKNHRYARQSFLPNQDNIQQCVVGIVGLGGGGSHIVQQLAHIGFTKFRLFDPDVTEDVNLNRLVGANTSDVINRTPKVQIGKRVIAGLQESADVKIFQARWQDVSEHLKCCDVIFGCVDGFSERRELEICSRRYLIPYIDIGMDIRCIKGQPPRMAGQVILSMPDGPCMYCLAFLTEARLAEEASRYGDAGPRPQVIWANGILASVAVGIAIDLLTNWSSSSPPVIYLSFDGNKLRIEPHIKLKYLKNCSCSHYSLENIGDPKPKSF
jgi:hypothetical protein